MSATALRKSMRVIAVIAAAAAMIITALPSNAAVSGAAATPKVCLPVYLTATGRDANPDPGPAPALINTVSDVFLARHKVATTKAGFTPGGVVEGSLAFAGPIVFTPLSSTSTLTANVQGDVNLTTGKFRATSTSVTGMGALSGISGSLTFIGTQDFVEGSFTETITGTLCLRVRPW